MSENLVIKVIFVCLGNICRSPMAEAVFQHQVDEAGLGKYFEVASGGTSHWHVGERPHQGTQNILKKMNVQLKPAKTAMQVSQDILNQYDYIIAMDHENVLDMPPQPENKVFTLMQFAPKGYPKDVPDPYYTGSFDKVYEIVEAGCKGLLAFLREEHNLND